MKKNTLVLFPFFAVFSVSAKEVVSTQGDSYSNASANIDFTIGEMIINTESDNVDYSVCRANTYSSMSVSSG